MYSSYFSMFTLGQSIIAVSGFNSLIISIVFSASNQFKFSSLSPSTASSISLGGISITFDLAIFLISMSRINLFL